MKWIKQRNLILTQPGYGVRSNIEQVQTVLKACPLPRMSDQHGQQRWSGELQSIRAVRQPRNAEPVIVQVKESDTRTASITVTERKGTVHVSETAVHLLQTWCTWSNHSARDEMGLVVKII